ncbi:MAG TPA: DUF2232 domain-containing protein [Bacillota bacterium]|nr:DUF2232 domain-containing protein [Bacillota bacterium]
MRSARPLTESALAAAVCVVVWALSMGLPGLGGYVRYMTPSLIAIVGARHGARWSLAACAVTGAGIGITLGPTQLLISLLLGAPTAVMLPLMKQRVAPALWWGLASAVYAVAVTGLGCGLAALYGAGPRDYVSATASANYAALGGLWAWLGVGPGELAAFAGRSAWFILPGVGVVSGVMMYLINVVPYRIGLRTLDRTRRRR